MIRLDLDRQAARRAQQILRVALNAEGQAIRWAAFWAVLENRCPDCGRVRGPKHMEVCPGPFQRIAPPPVREPECDCPPGAWHERGCDFAYWPEDAA